MEHEVEGVMEVKSEKLKSFLKGIWAFCSYVFVPQRRPKDDSAAG